MKNQVLKPVIVGTAGHVDHGKTTLIKALTGVDTDRLKQEKERGISIQLGFAPLLLPDGRLAGVVDVPGHEKFIPQMLAGAASMDLVLLVVDAAEGVMPQTLEHVQILQLLNVRRGIVVLNKIDLVEEEWLDIVEEEIREQLAGTFLQSAPCCRVSALQAQGLEALLALLGDAAGHLVQRDSAGPVRLSVDRCFTVSGFGTVVTGTLVSGTARLGERLEILPCGKQTRVRELQVHGHKVESAEAGQRVAMNLAGAERGWFSSGALVASPHRFVTTERLDVRLNLLPTALRALRFRDPIHFYLGTARAVGRVVLLEADTLEPGASTLAQIVLDRPLAAWRGDPFVIRSYSPVTTIGGGRILDATPRKHKRFRADVLARLQQLESGRCGQLLHAIESLQAARLRDLERLTGLSRDLLQQGLAELDEAGEIIRLAEQWLPARLQQAWLEQLEDRCQQLLDTTPLAQGIGRATLKEGLPAVLALRSFDLLIEQLQQQNRLVAHGELLAPPGWQPRVSAEQAVQLEQIQTVFEHDGLAAANINHCLGQLGYEYSEVEGLIAYLVGQGRLVRLNSESYLAFSAYQRAVRQLKQMFAEQPEVSLAAYRDRIDGGRRLAQALLEHFDGLKYTRRQGDVRLAWQLPEEENL
jgi:selenocysteine-specific elongation factor